MDRSAREPVEGVARGTNAAFQKTRWSMVLRACAGSKDALEELSQAYWPALYAFLRHKGFPPADAEDVTQDTFSRLLKLGTLTPVEPAKGRFRSFLRACAEHEAAHFREQAAAAKRGRDRTVSLDMLAAEDHYRALPAVDAPTEHVFDRAWSQIIVSRALDRLASDYRRLGKTHVYDALVPTLQAGPERGEHRAVAEKLGVSDVAARAMWVRFKAAFVGHLRREVAETVNEPSEIEPELRYLLSAWGSTVGA